MREQRWPARRQALETCVTIVRLTAHATEATGRLALFPMLRGLETVEALRPPLVKRLRAEWPLSEATLAVDAIQRGRKEHDSELTTTGEAMLTHALESAALDPVSDEVADTVIGMADAIGLDPGAAPVSPDVAHHASQALVEFRRNHG
jgi:hypothetical protein